MTVGDLIEKLRDYPRDMEVVLARIFDGHVDGKLYDLDKVRMKEVVSDGWETLSVATDDDFDEDNETFNAVVLYPEA